MLRLMRALLTIALAFAGTCLMTFGLLNLLSPPPRVEIRNSFNEPDRQTLRAAVTLEFEHQLSLRMARSQYPDLLEPGSALAEAVAAREQALQDNDDPLLNDGDYPMTLADEEAERLGIAPVPPVVWRKW